MLQQTSLHLKIYENIKILIRAWVRDKIVCSQKRRWKYAALAKDITKLIVISLLVQRNNLKSVFCVSVEIQVSVCCLCHYPSIYWSMSWMLSWNSCNRDARMKRGDVKLCCSGERKWIKHENASTTSQTAVSCHDILSYIIWPQKKGKGT